MLPNMKCVTTIDCKRVAGNAVAALALSLFIYLRGLCFPFKNGVYNCTITSIAIVTVLLLIWVVLFLYSLKIYRFIPAIAVLPVRNSFFINYTLAQGTK